MAKKLFLVPEIIPAGGRARETLHRALRPSFDALVTSVRLALASAQEQEDRIEGLLARSVLTGETGLLLAILGLLEDGGRATHVITLGFDEPSRSFTFDTATTLEDFWALVKDFRAGEDLIVGHDLLGQALPYLCRMSAILRVQSTIDLCWRSEGANPYVFDTMRAWAFGGRAERVRLEELSLILGRGDDLRVPSGEQIGRLLAEGRHAELRERCLRKVSKLYGIYYQMTCGEAGEMEAERMTHVWRVAK